jgi:hypothetical protein
MNFSLYGILVTGIARQTRIRTINMRTQVVILFHLLLQRVMVVLIQRDWRPL